ncbi:hypothetical protein C723_2623 [Christiangramia flava JLT2011]|uniref:Uncharacterized protein n=1 Tax=Christiangramia flava JLT2011 TaxID=1229726 RepID=A0A1L7HZJ0_9FLAO|nr:hypothetical protein GRFL_0025 [Christiangramia flava JLT2011]OSS38386.1 hypothetical protein C723_2623 [Christiangramia flava JLT2011]
MIHLEPFDLDNYQYLVPKLIKNFLPVVGLLVNKKKTLPFLKLSF